MSGDWATVALRLSRRANQRAEFHERLIQEGTRMSLTQRTRRSQRIGFLRVLRVLCVRHELFGDSPEPRAGFLVAWIFFDPENPREHANDVAVEDRRRLIERDAADRSGGVAAN